MKIFQQKIQKKHINNILVTLNGIEDFKKSYSITHDFDEMVKIFLNVEYLLYRVEYNENLNKYDHYISVKNYCFYVTSTETPFSILPN